METTQSKTSIIAIGGAIFTMFFGAGNIVFPLALGQYSQSQTPFAILGLLLTAVGVPLIGLIAMTLYNGNYKHFFERMGKVPGFLIACLIMALIGPLGALPRLITLSHATSSMYWTDIPAPLFSALCVLFIFLFTFNKNKIVNVLGYYFTPALLLTLVMIIVIGFFNSPPAPVSTLSNWHVFTTGLLRGYGTMDLLGALFFSSVVLSCLESTATDQKNFRTTIFTCLKASVLGMGLVAAIYIGFCYVAAFNSEALAFLPPERLLGAIALQHLGTYAGIIAVIAVVLACITTGMALAIVFAEFLHNDITLGKMGYIPSLILTLLLTFVTSTLGFGGIMTYLTPVLTICYPALIVLSLLNIGHKLFHWTVVKTPVWVALVLSVIFYFV